MKNIPIKAEEIEALMRKVKSSKKYKMKKQIPNLITLLNLFFGCLAILVTFQSGTMATLDETGDMVIEIPEQIILCEYVYRTCSAG